MSYNIASEKFYMTCEAGAEICAYYVVIRVLLNKFIKFVIMRIYAHYIPTYWFKKNNHAQQLLYVNFQFLRLSLVLKRDSPFCCDRPADWSIRTIADCD